MVHNDVKHREGEARDMTASARVTVAAGLVQHTGPATEAPVRLRSLRGRHASSVSGSHGSSGNGQARGRPAPEGGAGEDHRSAGGEARR